MFQFSKFTKLLVSVLMVLCATEAAFGVVVSDDAVKEFDGKKLCLVKVHVDGGIFGYSEAEANVKMMKLNKKNNKHYYFVEEIGGGLVSSKLNCSFGVKEYRVCD